MTQKSTTVSIKGLALLPNDISVAPEGSCSICDNVQLRRPGSLEPAEGLTFETLTGITGDDTIYKSHGDALDGYVVSFIKNDGDDYSATGLYTRNLDTDDQAYFTWVYQAWGGGSPSTYQRPLQFEPGRSHATFSRDRRIITGERAPVTLTRDTEDAAWELRISGLQQPGGVKATDGSTSGTVVAPDGKQAYYRVTFVRKYQTYDLESAPTAPFLYVNDSGSNRGAVSVSVGWSPDTSQAQIGDLLIVYRTPFVDIGVDPGDAFQECTRHTLEVADLLGFTGFVSLSDKCPDGALGDYLYTNTQQQGALQANYPPPDSRGVVTFNDTTFYASNQDWPTMSFGINDFGSINGGGTVGVYTGTATSSGTGATFVTFNGDITSVIVPGMVLVRGITKRGYITAVSLSGGNTRVDFDNSYGLPGTAGFSGSTTWIVADTIAFEFENYDGSTSNELFVYESSDPWEIPYSLNNAGSALGGTAAVALGVVAPAVTMTLTQTQAGRCRSFTITASHGEAYTQMDSVNTTTHFATKASTQRNATTTVYFSKTSLPEAVPPSNRLEIGHGEILRLISDNNSWYALCTDGVYRVTGLGNDWTVIQVSKTARLVHPDAACVHNGVVFGWFADGICSVTESGVQNISEMALGPAFRDEARRVLQNWRTIWGVWLAAHDIERELYLNVNQYDPDDSSWDYSTTYVYNVLTQQWCTRSYLAAQSGAYCPEQSQLFFGKNEDSLPKLKWVDGLHGWANPHVLFNCFSAGAPGYLKQWIDLNLIIKQDVDFYGALKNEKLQFLFDDDTATLHTYGWRLSTEWSLQREHMTVPRRSALRDDLTVGFYFTGLDGHDDAQSVYFQLQGITLRYRVASETFQQ